MPGKLTTREIRRVARRTIEKLEDGGFRCCVFGSLACSVWGMQDRVPADIDIVVFGQHNDPEQIKAYLASASESTGDNRFTLQDARDSNDYKVLYYNASYYPRHKRCKVDILVSGFKSPLGIPGIPKGRVARPNSHEIPVVPFLVLIILKVQGWRDYRTHRKPWLRAKTPQSIRDIMWLLNMLDNNDHLGYFHWLPRWFIKQAEELVKKFTDKYPDTTSSFRSIGFGV
ncbi:hypothetical protein AX15_001527 [Amanita polypyramis BW_CC]|nr:hypothetical protein AX15_001527 [Amanita polypyramis BW_CC]